MPTLSRSLLAAATLLAGHTAQAQCTFVPTVTPNNLMLCPNTQDTLRTQVYDAYQWYKDGNLIPGATQRTLVVDQYADAGSQFSVEATLNGCTARSAQVLVDGWVFAGLTVMSSGNFAIDPSDGHTILCDSTALHPRDTIRFEVMQPYTSNVKWYRNNQPIVGATQPVLVVTQSGTYSVEGSPASCPTFVRTSLPLDVEVRRPSVPTISLQGTQLVATPAPGVTFSRHEWYRNGVQVSGATSATLTPPGPGSYRVQGDDGICWAVSDVFHYPPLGLPTDRPTTTARFFPNPVTDVLHVEATSPVGLTIRDAAGRLVMSFSEASQLNVRPLPAGLYFLSLTDRQGRLIRVEKLMKQ